jgi:hypothetical protein
MRTGTHARDDGSFGRSAGTQTAKGAALIAVAVLIGAFLLHTAPRTETITSTSPVTQPPAAKTTRTTTPPPGPTTTTTPPPRPTAQVHVEVANGTQVIGLGGKIRSQLSTDGYNTDKPALDAPTKDHATSQIFFQPGFQSDALQLASTLSVAATAVVPMPNPAPVPQALTGVDILVIAGTDIAGTGGSSSGPSATVAPGTSSGSGSSSGSTSTTVHHTTTTVHHTTTTVAHASTTTTKP